MCYVGEAMADLTNLSDEELLAEILIRVFELNLLSRAASLRALAAHFDLVDRSDITIPEGFTEIHFTSDHLAYPPKVPPREPGR